MLPWTPPSLSYSCVESHCWCGHHSSRCSKATGGSHFIRAVIRTAGESLDLTASRGDRREDLVERAEDGTKFQGRRSQKESASRMTPVTLALTWSLLSIWTVTSAVQFQEKGKSSQTPALRNIQMQFYYYMHINQFGFGIYMLANFSKRDLKRAKNALFYV